jgi:butyrate kinase
MLRQKLIQDAMSYNIESYCFYGWCTQGKVDAMYTNGGIAHNDDLVDYIKDMVGFMRR